MGMNWLHDNLAVLQRCNAELAVRVLACHGNAHAPADVTDDAQRTAAEHFWDAGFPATDIVIFYGCDLGYHLQAYFSRCPDWSRVVVVERSIGLFREALARHDWRGALADGRVTWCIGETPDQLASWWRTHGLEQQGDQPRQWTHLKWLPAVHRDGFYYVAMAREISAVLALANSAVGSPEDAFRGLINICGNVMHMAAAPSFEAFVGRYKEYPGVVVSTGPSLDAALPFLQAVQDRVVIFAVDSAAAILLKAGIKPHFIACLERVVATKPLMEVLPPLEDTWLVALPVISPETVAAYRGPICFLGGNFDYQWVNPDLVPRQVGSSAATMAFAGLELLGCDPLILVGQDLAFDPSELRTHAQDTNSFVHEAGKAAMRHVIAQNSPDDWVMGNSGKKIRTRMAYRIFAEDLNRMIQMSGKRCINAIGAHYGMRLSQAVRMDPDAAFTEFRESVRRPRRMLRHEVPGRFGADPATMLQTFSDIAFWLQKRHMAELDTMLRISRFYHEHLPSLVTPEIEQRYARECQALEHEVNRYLREEPYLYHFLWPYVGPKHREIAKEYYRREDEVDFHEGVGIRLNCWQLWSRNMLLWTGRTEQALMTALRLLAQNWRDACSHG